MYKVEYCQIYNLTKLSLVFTYKYANITKGADSFSAEQKTLSKEKT